MNQDNKPSKIFMVRPASFMFNVETAENNHFQNNNNQNVSEIHSKALKEFDAMVKLLQFNKINVTIFNDSPSPVKPDAIFPNNWISIHNHTMVLYPMFAKVRRDERNPEIINQLKKHTETTLDLSSYENENKFLEGTGSIIFDHPNKKAYACISERTHPELLINLCNALNYHPVLFSAFDNNNFPVYHTNVIMSIGKNFAILCSESIFNPVEREMVLNELSQNKKTIINISLNQANNFAGNAYQLYNEEGKSFILMSKCGFNSLNTKQKETLSNFGSFITPEIPTIEYYGGGSVRCMITEIN